MPVLPDSPLEINFFPHDALIPRSTFDHVLRLSRYNGKSLVTSKDPRELGANLAVPHVGDQGIEVWTMPSYTTSAKTANSGNQSTELLITKNRLYTHVRFVCHETNKQKHNGKRQTRSSKQLRDLTFNAYRKMFELIHNGTLPANVVRMWNFIPDILIHDDMISNHLNSERYRQFNAGRQEAWWQYSRLNLDTDKKLWRVPAATGIGSMDGPLIIEALLTDGTVIDINNPRQTLPYQYSPLYGKNSPMFSRATAHILRKDYGLLFIAGTASIVGEQTLHQGSVRQQVHETFRNFQALTSVDNLKQFLPFTPKPLGWADFRGVRVHIKHSRDYSVVQKIVQSYLGQQLPVCYVCDDICRSEWLVEIEANAIELIAAV